MFHVSVDVRPSTEWSAADKLHALWTMRKMEARLKNDPILFPESEIESDSAVFVEFQWNCELKVYNESGIDIDDIPMQTLPFQRGTMVLLLAIPNGFDVATLLAPYTSSVKCVSILPRTKHINICSEDDFDRSAILVFSDQSGADSFYRAWHLQCFDSNESQGPVCYLLFIDKFKIDMFSDQPPPPLILKGIKALGHEGTLGVLQRLHLVPHSLLGLDA